jgi:Protein of unknown function (DUF1003)
MMSQNRQEARDRLHAMRDHQVNLKAELEIRHLHQKAVQGVSFDFLVDPFDSFDGPSLLFYGHTK